MSRPWTLVRKLIIFLHINVGRASGRTTTYTKAPQYTGVCPEALRKTTTESKLVSKPRFEPEILEIEEVAILTP